MTNGSSRNSFNKLISNSIAVFIGADLQCVFQQVMNIVLHKYNTNVITIIYFQSSIETKEL